ncbi:MAG TPA: spore coat U domain-containing protein [Allosphingosinicella sp.]|nr:spore coat U domain-containing protein [Allosphingosinicella sp.]
MAKGFAFGIATAVMTIACGTSAQAQIAGTIDATMTLTTGCIINSQNLADGATSIDFGTISFGSHSSLFTQADAEVVGTGAGIAIQCTPGVAPSLVFGAGENDGEGTGAGNRAMVHATSTDQFVNYGLYSNSGRTTLITIGGSIALSDDGSAQTVHVYGRAFGAPGLETGNYSDTVLVTLEL